MAGVKAGSLFLFWRRKMKLIIKKDVYKSLLEREESIKLAYFKNEILKVLNNINKDINIPIEKAIYGIGDIREWHDGKYKKIAPGKWRKIVTSNSGAKIAIETLKKDVNKCKTSQELLNLVLLHQNRFYDKQGNPFPIVQELSDYVSKKNDELETPTAKRPYKKIIKENKKNYTKKKRIIFTDKPFLYMSKKERKALVDDFKRESYLIKDGVFVYNGRLSQLGDKKKYNEEIKLMSLIANDNEVYLVPHEYTVSGVRSADGIINNNMADIKRIDTNVGDNFSSAKEQGRDALISIKYDISVADAIKQIEDKIKEWKLNEGKHEKAKIKLENVESKVFLYFEKTGNVVELDINKNGLVKIHKTFQADAVGLV